MITFLKDLNYEFRAKGIDPSESIKQYTNHLVKDIKIHSKWDTEVQISISPLAKDKRLFTVLLNVYGLGESISIRKVGTNVISLLKKVRKEILRQVHNKNKIRIGQRKRHHWREQLAL